jgi:uncharacterized phage protein (TIGR01671 family)
MREILFRGKRVENDEWVDGYYCSFNGVSHRIYTGYAETDCGEYYPDCYEVIPKTVRQYTGLTDKNGTKIFEGDIVVYCTNTNRATNKEFHEVVFETRGESGYFGIKISNIETWQFCLEVPAKLMEIIGNIYDNPELLGGETNARIS